MTTVSEQQALRAPKTLGVHSSAFTNGRALPREHSSFGDDVSPPISWSGLPDATQTLAIVMDDPDAPGGTFTHWLVWDLPATLRELTPGADVRSLGAREGQNDFGFARYMGPKPPSGTHRYFIRVFAISKRLGIEENATAERVWSAIAPNVLAWGEIMGTFTRP